MKKGFMRLTEGKASVYVPNEKKISKELPVFYNSVMQFNRDVTIWLLKALGVFSDKKFSVADIHAGTGVRSIRIALETGIKRISAVDIDKDACTLIERNCKENNVEEVIEVVNKDCNEFLLKSKGFHYIDIDPFGSPNKFLNNSIERIARGGILAVTATDTSALAGTFSSVCARKYWAKPLRNELMHEVGLRILARKVQLIGAQFEKALVPIYSYSKDHYMRIFFVCQKSKKKCDEVLNEHKYLLYCEKCGKWITGRINFAECCNKVMRYSGPLFCGSLLDAKLAKKMVKMAQEKKDKEVLSLIADEALIDTVGIFDIHALAKKHKINPTPRTKKIIDAVRKEGYKIASTHIAPAALRSDMPFDDFVSLLKKL